MEYGLGGGWDDKGTGEEFKGEWSYLAAMGNIGYRWRSTSGVLMNLGVYGGMAFGLTDEGYYTGGPGGTRSTTTYEYDTEVFVFGMLEWSVGMEF